MGGGQCMAAGGCWAKGKSHSGASTPVQSVGLSSHLQRGLGSGSWSSLLVSPTPHSTPFPWLGAVTPSALCPTL